MEGRTLRVRAPVNYKAEASGTNTPGWLKSKTITRVFSEAKSRAPAKPDNDKENKAQDQKHAKKETAGGKSGRKQSAKLAEVAAESNKQPGTNNQADTNKQAGRKEAAAAKKASANKKQAADKTLADPASQSAAKHADIPNVIDLLTPVDLIKKSSANRLKQKQADEAQQLSAAEPAVTNAAKAAPAGKKAATRGRNANLQVVEVEPQAKRGKRKAASETADKLVSDKKASPTSEQLDQNAFLPNRKRSKSSKSAQKTEAAAAAADVHGPADAQQPSTVAAISRAVPGLPGVKHQMPILLGAMAQGTKQTTTDTTAAMSVSRSQSGTARSNNSRRQASSGKAARAPEVSNPEGVPQPQSNAATEAAGAASAVDKPADRSVAAAMQPTLASAGAPQGIQFQRLQEEYAQLQNKYAELKERKIEDLDSMLQEHTAKLAAHNETAVKLADHWRQEAHRQAAFAQAAGSPAMQAELKQGKEEVQKLKAALLQSEAAVLQKERQLVDLRKQMKEEWRRAEAPLQMDQALQTDAMQHADLEVQVHPSSLSKQSHCDVGQQFPSSGLPNNMDSNATPAAAVAKKQSLHLEEAKEMCPEGHELSESYRAEGLPYMPTSTPSHVGAGSVQIDSSAKPLVPYPLGISGQGPARQPSRSRLANTASAEEGTPSNAGQVQIQSSAKPLVPYPVGISVQPQSHDRRRSRFAEEGDAAGRPAMTPHPIRDVHTSPQAALQTSVAEPTAEKQHGLPKSMSAMMLPRAVALAKATALPLPASPVQDIPREAPARSSGNIMAVGRLLDFPSDARLATPEGKEGSGAEGPEPMEMDMSLTGSAQMDEAQMLNQNALHALMGLEATPIKAGGFKYIHRDTGMVFEIAPATPDSAGQESDADSGEPELCFNPVSLGKAVEMLPSYLQYEIKFGASQRQTLVGRIMEALGKCKVLHKNMQG